MIVWGSGLMNGLEPVATAFLGGIFPTEVGTVDLKSGLELLLKGVVGFAMIGVGLAIMEVGLVEVGFAVAVLYAPAVLGLAMGEGEE